MSVEVRSESDDGYIAEYYMLKDEIKSNATITAQIFTVTITAVGLLIGYGIQNQSWFVFLSPFIILIPSLWYISSQMETTIKIGSYIKTFIEPIIEGIDWENRLFLLRTNFMSTEKKYSLSIIGVYALLGTASLLLSWIFIESYTLENIIMMIIISIILGGFLIVEISFVKKCFTFKYFEEYCKKWEEIKKDK